MQTFRRRSNLERRLEAQQFRDHEIQCKTNALGLTAVGRKTLHALK